MWEAVFQEGVFKHLYFEQLSFEQLNFKEFCFIGSCIISSDLSSSWPQFPFLFFLSFFVFCFFSSWVFDTWVCMQYGYKRRGRLIESFPLHKKSSFGIIIKIKIITEIKIKTKSWVSKKKNNRKKTQPTFYCDNQTCHVFV